MARAPGVRRPGQARPSARAQAEEARQRQREVEVLFAKASHLEAVRESEATTADTVRVHVGSLRRKLDPSPATGRGVEVPAAKRYW